MRLCMVGCGRWGRAYLKTIESIESISVDWIVVRKTIPKMQESYFFSYDLDELLELEFFDGVVIASPPDTHFNLAKICIKHKVPVLVEKPFTQSYEQSNYLKEEFDKEGLICMVGYQHLFSEKYRLLKKQASIIGKIKTVYSIAVSDGPYRENVPVVRDWGSHEIATALDLFNEFPISISINKVKKSYTNRYKGLYYLEMYFSKQRKYNSFFGNQSIAKKKQLILEFDNGFIYQDNLDQIGNIIISQNKFLNLNEVNNKYNMPLESLVKEFKLNVKNNIRSPILNLSVNVNKVLDEIEVKCRE